jgi:hypothetical protein
LIGTVQYKGLLIGNVQYKGLLIGTVQYKGHTSLLSYRHTIHTDLRIKSLPSTYVIPFLN